MNEYILSCSSTSDLSVDYYKKMGISWIPFHYYIDGKEYVDDFGKTLPISQFYKKMEEGAMTKTAQISEEEYEKFFESFLKEGKDILHLTLSSGLSGTINSATLAKSILEKKYPDRKIYVIDSLGASSGYGLLMDKLAQLKKGGMAIDDLRDYAVLNRLNLNHWFFSTDLKYYVRGGRISKASGFIGNILHICPLLDMDKAGKLIPMEKVRTLKKVEDALINKMIENAKDGLNYSEKCFISHSAFLDDAKRIAKRIEGLFPHLNGKIEIFDIGTTIGAHTGPGTIALFFFGKTRQ